MIEYVILLAEMTILTSTSRNRDRQHALSCVKAAADRIGLDILLLPLSSFFSPTRSSQFAFAAILLKIPQYIKNTGFVR
jgi:hypothetical protein